jgi:predicted amidohydrolase YtcJ
MILYHNGIILTLNKNNIIGTSLLVDKEKIVGVFNSVDEFDDISNTDLVDLEGKTVIPGFNDNHIHMNFLGDSLKSLHFHNKNEEEIASLLKMEFPTIKKNEIIFAYDWDYPACRDPRKEMLDEVFPENPVILSQYGGHSLWVNSTTLKKMKIDRNTPDPDEGIICRDESGEPTGIIKDVNNSFLNKWFIKRLISISINRNNIVTALKKCTEYGITSVQDNTWSFTAMMVIRKLFKQGKLTVRMSCWSHGESALFRFLFNLQKFNNSWFRKGPAKFFIDGTFSGRTAWLNESYSGSDENCGKGKTKEKIIKILEKEIKRKQQCAFHAIGDRAVSEYLDALETLSEKYNYIPDLRFRLEHAQLISAKDMGRIKKLGVLICAQPSALNNPEKDKTILGESRALRAYPYRSLLDKGILLSFGSDAPGESTVNPFESIHFAVNRKGPEQITVEEALKCYTSASAYAEFKEDDKGSLSRGMYADFLILSDNPLTVDKMKISGIIVERCFINGKEIIGQEQ